MATAYQTFAELEPAVSEQLQAHARAADEWECYRHPHSSRLAAIADALARKFNLAAQDRFALRLAAWAHDLGALVMRRDYIGRSGPLTLEERLDLARHPVISEQEAMRLGAPRAVQLIARWHHESWNGGGYPDALQREQIPFAARILRVADAYAALTDERPFRPAYSEEEALRIIAEEAGIEFDPSIVQALFALEDIPELRSYKPVAAPPAAEIYSPPIVENYLPAPETETPQPAPAIAAGLLEETAAPPAIVGEQLFSEVITEPQVEPDNATAAPPDAAPEATMERIESAFADFTAAPEKEIRVSEPLPPDEETLAPAETEPLENTAPGLAPENYVPVYQPIAVAAPETRDAGEAWPETRANDFWRETAAAETPESHAPETGGPDEDPNK
jgi:hypothetical protein